MIAGTMTRTLALVAALCGLLAACETPNPTPSFPELSYSHLGKIPLDVARIEVERAYTSPGKAPNVEHLFPVSPMASAEHWARDRLQAAGTSGVARAIISQASVVEVPLQRTKGIRGVFTKDQSERYDGVMEMSIQILGDDGREKASVRSRTERSRSVPEDASPNDREKAWYEMTQAMMNDLNTALQAQIIEHLGAYLR